MKNTKNYLFLLPIAYTVATIAYIIIGRQDTFPTLLLMIFGVGSLLFISMIGIVIIITDGIQGIIDAWRGDWTVFNKYFYKPITFKVSWFYFVGFLITAGVLYSRNVLKKIRNR